ncbi:MAG: integration host factor subunit alpha [Holosporaceae bacterium]|jgi:integration host factor subunit alpha|nr:integration host factor subunit alpha [Holosporaceae bacterium]
MKNKETKTLTRSDLANAITEEFRVTKFNALEIVEDVLDEIAGALINGETVKISGFGTFTVRNKKERIGRNPKTLKEAVISSRKSLSFRASPVLKKIVNNHIEQ